MIELSVVAALADMPRDQTDALRRLRTTCGIDTMPRLREFLGACQGPNGDWATTVEPLRYSAGALVATWPAVFPDVQSTVGYALNAKATANRVYAGKLGNGAERSGDGWRFRGRGYLMLRGRHQYARFSADWFDDDRLVLNPGLVAQEPLHLMSAGWLWWRR